jgi:hypothetical protein
VCYLKYHISSKISVSEPQHFDAAPAAPTLLHTKLTFSSRVNIRVRAIRTFSLLLPIVSGVKLNAEKKSNKRLKFVTFLIIHPCLEPTTSEPEQRRVVAPAPAPPK